MNTNIKRAIAQAPMLGPIAIKTANIINRLLFPGSKEYWEGRYANGGTSGSGSYGAFAEFKAEVINNLVAEQGIQSVAEFGCGDGAQLSLAQYPRYIGLDISKSAIKLCQEKFQYDQSKSFILYDPNHFTNNNTIFKADLALSLDVIYHLTEDTNFEVYMKQLFDTAKKWVVIYSSDMDQPSQAAHVKHRQFSKWVNINMPDWELVKIIPNRYPYRGDERTGSFADFFIYQKISNRPNKKVF